MNRITFTVPGKPFGMQRVVPRRGGAPFMEKKSRVAMQRIQKIARQAFEGQQPFIGPVRIQIWAIFAVPRSWPDDLRSEALAGMQHLAKPDAKNIAWLVEDALPGIAFIDDKQVSQLISFKRYGNPARTEVTIEALDIGPVQLRHERKRIAENEKRRREARKA